MQPQDYMPTEGCDQKRLTENCNVQLLHRKLLDAIVSANAPPPISDMSDDSITSLLESYERLAADPHNHPLYKPAVDFIKSISHQHFGHESAWANRRSNPIDMVAAIRDGILGEDAQRYMNSCTEGASQDYASKYIEEFENSHPDMQRLAAIGYHMAPSVFVNFSNQSAHIEWVRQRRLELDKELQRSLLEKIPGKELTRIGRPVGGLDDETFEQIIHHAIAWARPIRSQSTDNTSGDATVAAWQAAQSIPITADNLSSKFEYQPEDDSDTDISNAPVPIVAQDTSDETMPRKRKFALTLNLAPTAVDPESSIASTVQSFQLRKKNLVQTPLLEVGDPFNALIPGSTSSHTLMEPIVEALALESMASGQEKGESDASDA